jgi:hypothetical protein
MPTLFDDYEPESATALDFGVSTRTVKNYRRLPDSKLRWLELGGKIYIHKPSKAEFLASRTQNANSKSHPKYPPRRRRA